MLALKIIKFRNSAGFALPKEAQSKLEVEPGDTIFLIETPDGYRITPHDPSLKAQMTTARRIAKKRRHALRALAK